MRRGKEISAPRNLDFIFPSASLIDPHLRVLKLLMLANSVLTRA